MPRQLRIQYAGAIYHLTVRGNAQGDIYLDDKDRRFFLSSLAKGVEEYAVRIYLYCLMTNHCHLVVETPRANVGRFMHSLLTGYTVYFNLRHQRHGHLTQGRYGAKLVQGDEYLLKLSRYVHLNPVHVHSLAGRSLEERRRYLRAYPWSSYRAYTGRSVQQPWVTYGPMLALMGGRGRALGERYSQFVEAALETDDEDFKSELARSPRSLGGEAFRKWVDDFYAGLVERRRRPEDAAFRKTEKLVTPQEVLGAVARVAGVEPVELLRRKRNWIWRSLVARCLCRLAGLTRRECARTLGLSSGAAVSYHVRQAEQALLRDGKLRALSVKIEKGLGRHLA